MFINMLIMKVWECQDNCQPSFWRIQLCIFMIAIDRILQLYMTTQLSSFCSVIQRILSQMHCELFMSPVIVRQEASKIERCAIYLYESSLSPYRVVNHHPFPSLSSFPLTHTPTHNLIQCLSLFPLSLQSREPITKPVLHPLTYDSQSTRPPRHPPRKETRVSLPQIINILHI